MKKLVAAAAAALLLGAIAPVVSHAATGGGAAPAPARRVSEALEATLASSSTAPIRVLVQATSRAAAIDAVRAAGLHLDDVLESVGVAVATGTPSDVRSLTHASHVTYVEQDRALKLFGDDTADVATRTAEARAANSPVLKQTTTTTTTDDRHGNGHGNGGVGQGRGNGNAGGPTTVTTTTTDGAYTGAGESIAIVDSGVDGTHPMFTDPKTGESKVVVNMKLACTNDGPFVLPDTCPTGADVDPFFVDLSPVNDSDTPSGGGHGTHVAGIAAGYPVKTADGRTLMGTAPGAKIVSLSIGQTLSIYGSNAALDWIVRHHADPCGDGSCPPITVVNNSYGGGTKFDPQSSTTLLQDALVDAGVVMVWANGNGDQTNDGGDGSKNLSSADSMDPKRGSISVANYDDHETGTRDGTLDPSSSRGAADTPETWPDVSAPGANITSACRPYLAVCRGLDTTDPNYGTISGTSMATPHVVGIVALLREADPNLKPADVQNALENTAYKFQFGAPYWLTDRTGNAASSSSFDKGHGLVDTTAALAKVLGRNAGGPAAVCGSNDPGIKDDPGDASSVLGTATPLPSEDALDILDGSVSWDATAQKLTFGIHVKDLTDSDPAGTTGAVFDYVFSYGGVEYTLNESHGATTGDSAELQTFSPTRTTAAPATATSNVDTDTITIVLDNAHLGAVKPFATGDSLSGFTITSRRDEGVLVPDADTAHGSCPFTIGGATTGGGTTFPDPQPFPEPGSGGGSSSGSGTLHDGDTFTADATTTEDTSGVPGVDGVGCDGPSNPKCFNYTLQLQPGTADGSSLIVTLSPGSDEQIVTEDWDIYIYDAAGKQVNEPLVEVPDVVSADPGAGAQTVGETFFGSFATIPAAGTYTVVVVPYEVPKGSTVTVHADLTANSSSSPV